jgi:hypothetical protein
MLIILLQLGGGKIKNREQKSLLFHDGKSFNAFILLSSQQL